MRGEGHIDQGRLVPQLQTKAARERREELHEAQLLVPLRRRRLSTYRRLALNAVAKTGGEGSARDQGLSLRQVRMERTYLLTQERHPHIGVDEDALVVQGAGQTAQQPEAQCGKPLGAVHAHAQSRPRSLSRHPARQEQVPRVGSGRR